MMSDTAGGDNQFERGPHEYGGDDANAPAWWVDRAADWMYVAAHRVEAVCEECGESSLDDFIDGQAFVWACECTHETMRWDGETYESQHTIEVVPTPPAKPRDWRIFGPEGVDVGLELEDDHATVSFELEGEQRQWRLDSETYFDEVDA